MDISKEKTQINCTECNRVLEVTIKQVADEVTISCNCGQTIKLTDQNNSAKNAIKKINKSFNDLEKTLNKLGKKR